MKKPDSTNKAISIDNKTLIRVLLLVVAFVAGLQLIAATRFALTLIVIAFFFALALSPLVNLLARKITKQNRVAATGLAYLLTILILGGLVYSIAPVAIRQIQSFASEIPTYISELDTADHPVARFAQRFDLAGSFEQAREQIADNIGTVGEPLFRTLQTVLTSLAGMITILVLTFFMLVEGPMWLIRFWSLQPKSRLAKRQKLAYDMYRAVIGYVNGQLIIAFISGVITFILLSFLGMPYPLALAAIIAVTGLIPLIGNTLGAIIVIVVALFVSLGLAIFLAVFYIVYQQIENNIIQPAVQSQTVSLSPLAILISALIGISLAGFLGALLAIPVAGVIRVLVLYFIEEHKLYNR
jgi:predicted PurR-regulated permease PerM